MRLATLLLAIALAFPASAASDLVVVGPSSHSVKQSLDRLTEMLAKKGITVFARVDHAAGAKKVGQELAPTELLIFGNPKMGTPLMQANRHMGLELPMKVLAWQDDDGKVWLGYVRPETLKLRHAVTGKDELFAKMAGALRKLTAAAAGL